MSKEDAKEYTGKLNYCLVPRKLLTAVARIREYGNRKYEKGGPDNWKHVDPERWKEAAFRHFLAYLDDPTGLDAESGLPHLWHLACNIAFLCELLEEPKPEQKTWTGSRNCRTCRFPGKETAPCWACRGHSMWEPADHEGGADGSEGSL